MRSPHPAHAAPSSSRDNRAWSFALLAALLVLALAIGVWWAVSSRGNSNSSASTQSGPALSSTEVALAGPPADTQSAPELPATADPNACEIRFEVEGSALEPLTGTKDALYPDLPIPPQEGSVFAGWYTSETAATALDQTQRVNGSRVVTCENDPIVLHPAWVSPERNVEEGTQVPILMYHWFTTKPEGEDDWLKDNYLYVGDFDQHLQYISEQQFYLPTWAELSAFIDGELFLPAHSVIVTDDDAHPTWWELAVPIVEKHQVMTTAFLIGRDGAGPAVTPYVLKRSHSYDMHDSGENGQGLMVNWGQEAITQDLGKSVAQLGVAQVFAYPFGHYNDTAKAALSQAGFDLARTTEYGYVQIGSDKLALPTIRVSYGMGVDTLAGAIG